ncbi:Crp/Fnr family transcriptional regulator [Parvularcula marina]|uniref:Crp/Fnr family transcriptional regulator n=2 Tax=Parvularcula marina TaxID=2292771 RepID=A0A371RJF7_9PROT|nr:Crp/Fnr family transcriptional regulator [Parvularcula marina]
MAVWARGMIDKQASIRFELRQHAFFAGIDDDGLDDLIAISQIKIFKGRQAICRQGEDAENMYVVLSGRIKICTTSQGGKETVLAFMGPGEVLGEIAVLDGGLRTASAITIEESRVLVIGRTGFISYLETHPKVALNIIGVLCGRLRKTDEFVEEMTTLQAGPRLARALLRLAEQYGKPQPEGGILVDIKLSQANLGAHAGLMRENVNRQLKVWEDDGLLGGSGGLITLFRVDALEEIADQSA